MTKTKLSTKGQIIIPKSVRERHRWDAGTEFAIEDAGDGLVIRPVPTAKTTRPRDVLGILKHRGRPKTLAEMEEAIAAAAAENR